MNPYFYSLGMLVTRRMNEQAENLPLSAMDLLARAIADEEQEPSRLIGFLFRKPTDTPNN